MDSHIQTIIDDFALFDDWEARYTYLIDLGKSLPDMAENLKTEATLVPGCTSRVWMVPRMINGRLSFVADSDAHIVRGLIGVLMRIYQDRTPNEIKSVDINDIFHRIGLQEHLSPNRRSGFFAMYEKIYAYSVSASSND